MIETLKSTEILAKEGFKVMVYCNDDPLMAKRLENVGASAIMPLAAPIGSGLGILNKVNIRIIRNQTKLPLIIDAGLGQASDATIAMELGCDGVLVNTAIAKAKKPFDMALAFKNAVLAGRQSFISGRIQKKFNGQRIFPNRWYHLTFLKNFFFFKRFFFKFFLIFEFNYVSFFLLIKIF